MRNWVKALGAGLAMALLAGPAAAQEDEAQYEDQARAYLEAGMEAHTSAGYRAARNIPDFLKPLVLSTPYIWPVNLRAGENYRIYGACDDDCTDLDMEVYGRDGALVDRDIAVDDTPFVQITPERSGTHYVRLWVFTCAVEPCYAAARVVQGGTPIERQEVAPVLETTEVPGSGGYIEVVQGELGAAGEAHLAAGYSRLSDDVIVAIPLAGEGHRQAYSLAAGRSYLFQGACDQDCTDVDMEILDPSGAQVAVDIATDDRPVVAVTPAAAGDYTVRTWLATCTQEPCFVGVSAYVR